MLNTILCQSLNIAHVQEFTLLIHCTESLRRSNSSVTFGLGLVYGALRVRNSPEPCVTRREDVTFREVILRFLARRRVLRLF